LTRAQCPGEFMAAPAPSTGNAAEDTPGSAVGPPTVGGSAAPAPRPRVAAPKGAPAEGGATEPETVAADLPVQQDGQHDTVPFGSSARSIERSDEPADYPADDVHHDVAAFALGVLEDRHAVRFAAHLADCTRCADELDSMLAARNALAQIDADHLATAEQVLQDGSLLARLLEEAPEAAPPSVRRPVRLGSLVALVLVLVAAVAVVLLVT
jgi:hypothetical protein